MAKLLFVFGTRPEAIKLAPVIELAQKSLKFDVKVLVTAQHRHMLDQVLRIFNIKPDFDLNLMRNNQDLSEITVKIIEGCKQIFSTYKPDLVVVHGDTTTTFASSLAAFYHHVDVAHVEAGLRTFNIKSPFPEELNRSITTKIAKFHFSPTIENAQNLLTEKVLAENILITGNTVIDSVLAVLKKIQSDNLLETTIISHLKNLIPRFGENNIVLITGHRRESFGFGLDSICRSIYQLATDFPSVDFVYPLHLNPNVQATVRSILSGRKNIFLIEPLDYLPFVYLMSKSYFIITDSGGIQEEAPSLGKPVLVTRDVTERPEAVRSGVSKIVGTKQQDIVSASSELLLNPESYSKMSNSINPYGDGKASQKIINFLETKF